jgi:TetR/AcrR family transcriptional regulator, cholesterol catabolism regulator
MFWSGCYGRTRRRFRSGSSALVIFVRLRYIIRTNVRTFMASYSPITSAVSVRRRVTSLVPPSESRFDRRLGKILMHATDVFYEKGYEGASMRDLARSSGMSLSGLYYYFESKEKLLYLIQKHAFSTIVERLRQRLDGASDPEQRIRVVILNHLEYFLANRQAMKVLSHEAEVLNNGFGAEIAAIKRDYYRICVGLLDDFKRVKRLEFSSRMAVLSLFGMMNWIYTWYNPRVDAEAEGLSRGMGDIFLQGISAATRRQPDISKRSQKKKSKSRI